MGRFASNNYYVISPGNFTAYGPFSLLSVDPSHPLLSGVSNFSGGNASYRSDGNWVEGAVPIATWNDKTRTPLIGTRIINNTRRVDLNFYPPSSDVRNELWDSKTDGARIIANALTWVTSWFL